MHCILLCRRGVSQGTVFGRKINRFAATPGLQQVLASFAGPLKTLLRSPSCNFLMVAAEQNFRDS